MNKLRRKQLEDVTAKLEEAKSLLESLMMEEEEYRDNMPENMVYGEKYDAADSACDAMQEAVDQIEEAVYSIERASGE